MYYYKCRFILKSWKRDMNNRLYLENEKIKEIEEYCKKKTTRKKNKKQMKQENRAVKRQTQVIKVNIQRVLF
jgi:hypothetical protein